MEQFNMVIVGAGLHGLAMAKTYLEAAPGHGLKIVILDKAESIGGVWAKERLYAGLRTNNVVGSYEFSDFPMDLDRYGMRPGQHIPGPVVHQYLVDFAEAFRLETLIRLRTQVTAATLRDDDSWILDYSTHTNRAMHRGQMAARKLVVATGVTSEPNMPDFPGQPGFGGQIFHSGQLSRRIKDLQKSPRVVVIGANKSAMDVAHAAVSYGAEVHLIMRPSGGGPSWMWWPKPSGILRTTLARLSSTRLFTLFDPNPFGQTFLAVRHFLHRNPLGRLITLLFWVMLDRCAAFSIGYMDDRLRMMRPWWSTFWMGNSLCINNYDDDWFDMVRNGTVIVHHDEIISLGKDIVKLASGANIAADTIVSCTGWKSSPTIRIQPDPLTASTIPQCNNRKYSLKREEGSARMKMFNIKYQVSPYSEYSTLTGTEDPAEYSQDYVHTFGIAMPSDFGKISPGAADSSIKTTMDSPYRLYRFLVPPDPTFMRKRNFAFIGVHRAILAIAVAQAQALWITAFFQDQLPPVDDQQALDVTFLHSEYERLRRPAETGGSGARYPDLVFDSIPYVDLLLEDLGLNTMRKSTLWRNIFEPYSVRDYRNLPQEWIAKVEQEVL